MDEKGGKITFWGLLQIAFIVLKLCEVINWNWALVLLPFIIIEGGEFIYHFIANFRISRKNKEYRKEHKENN